MFNTTRGLHIKLLDFLALDSLLELQSLFTVKDFPINTILYIKNKFCHSKFCYI